MKERYVLKRVGEPLEDKGYQVLDREADEVIAWFQYLADADLFIAVLEEKERQESETKQ
ncbi:MAG: hypothetical protein WBZ33_06380 [Thermoactinomyces sp.]